MNKPSSLQRSAMPIDRFKGQPQTRTVALGANQWVRGIARAMAALLLCQSTFLAIPVYAQVAADPNAPAGQRPIMDAAQNGVPIVHIAPPSAAGVSRNQYDQFNVNQNGLILNNSPSAVQTQQGGWITGNLQLGPTPARIILNEVTGTHASQLRGTIEVAGRRADIVIANPNGLTCDGCGFLNSSRATLTTGRTQFNTDGSIRGFDVRQGELTIGGNGLNASNLEQLDLIARGIVIEGEVWAQNLNAIAGANQVLYGTLQAAAQSGTGEAPRFAIDIKDLGGMYANQIYLVSSELGVGVNSTGRTAALQGNLVLSANGDLSLQDSYAKQNLQINGAGNLNLAGQTSSEGDAAIVAGGNLNHAGSIDVQGKLSLSANAIGNSGTIVQRSMDTADITASAGVVNTGTLYSAGQLNLNAGALNNRHGQILAGQNAVVRAGSIDNTDGAIASTSRTSVVGTAGIDNTRGKIASEGELELTATSLSNQSGIVSAQQATAVRLGSGLLDNSQGQLIGAQTLTVQSGEIRNSAGAIASGAALALNTQGAALDNSNGGQIVASGDLTIASARFDNSNGTAASINGQLQVDAGNQELNNDGGKLQAGGNTRIAAGATSNRNGAITGQALTISTGAFDNDSGQIIAGSQLALSSQAFSNDRGLVQSVGNLQIATNGQALVNTNSGDAGGIVAGGALALEAGSLDNQAGFIAGNAGNTLAIAGGLDNRAANGQAGQIVSNANTTITAANILNQGSTIHALGDAAIATGLLDNRAGTVAAGGELALDAAVLDNRAHNGVAGSIDAGNITATVGTIDNRNGAMRAANDASFASSTLDNSGGALSAKRDLSVNATSVANTGGRMVGDQALTLTTSSQTLGGTIASANNVTLNVNGDYSNSSLLSAQNNLTVNAHNITNSGTMTAGDTLTANTGNLANSGEISGQNVLLNVSGVLTNAASGLIDGVDTRINAGTVNNDGRIYGDWLRVNAGTVNNSGTGVIAARDTLLIGAQTLNNTGGGLIYSLGDIGIGGSIDANGQLQGSMQSLTNASSKIEAGANMAIASTAVLNRNDNITTRQVTGASVYQEYVLAESGNKYPVSLCFGIGGGQKENSCIVHPDKYGLRSTVPEVYTTGCVPDGDSGNMICTTTANYTWDSPIFAQFQVAPISSPPPAEPTGGCSSTDPLTNQAYPTSSPACDQWRSAYAAWYVDYQVVLDQLVPKVNAYNAEVNEDNRLDKFWDYTIYKLTSTETRTELLTTAPGQILAGGNLAIAGSVTNRDSHIVAGGALSIAGPTVANIATQGEQRTDYSGTSEFTEIDDCGWSRCRKWYGANPYNPAPVVVMTDLPTTRYEQYVGDQTFKRTLAGGVGTADTSVAGVVSAAIGNSRAIAGQTVQASLTGAAPVALTVPNNSLFLIHPQPNARYLVETDPRFTNYRNFISSDYFLQALNRDPERQLKRYGDGFMEQQLINDQILALTGRRYLAGYSNTEDEYKALMDAGVAFAKAYQLAPGVALSAEQMSLLTTDIVWLVERTVTLKDGSTQQVLAPQVYLRRPSEGDLQANGALMAGSDVVIQTQGDLFNSGKIAGNTVTALAGNDLVNQGGRIAGQDIVMRASNDLKNLSGVIQGAGSNANVTLLAGRDIVLQTTTLGTINNDGSSTRSSVQRIATVAGSNVRIDAARDVNALGANVSAQQDLVATAGRDITIAAVAGEYQLHVKDKSGRTTTERTSKLASKLSPGAVTDGKATNTRSAYTTESALTHQTATFSAGNNIALVANNDVTLRGANVNAGQSGSGGTLIQGRNVEIAAVNDRISSDIQTVGGDRYDRAVRDNEIAITGSVTAADNITLRATGMRDGQVMANEGDIRIQGGNISAQNGQVLLSANNDVSITEATTRQSSIDEHYKHSKSGLFSTLTSNKSRNASATQSVGSVITGNSIAVDAGRDIAVRGSAIVADEAVTLTAANNVTITAATDTSKLKEISKVQEDGFLSGGSLGISYGTRTTTSDLDTDGTTQSGQARSLVGSTNGNLTIAAGEAVKVSGSDIAAGQNVNILGKNVTIDEGRDDMNSKLVTKMEQDAFTLAIGGTVVNAIQTIDKMSDAASKSKNPRIKALAAATTAMAIANAAKDVAANGASVEVSLTYGHSEEKTTKTQATSDAAGSTIAAGNNLNIVATGAGRDSNITIKGSDISAGNNVNLIADNQINLLAAQDTEEQHSKSESWSAAVGVAVTVGTSGMAFGVKGSASASKTKEDGSGVSQRNTHVTAGNTLNIQSGGDTNLKGAVASGKQVIADIGGDLNIASLQDTASFDYKNQSASIDATVGWGASVSLSYNQTKIRNDYASVHEQSGILAGDGGFDIRVKGNTDLKGAVIASTQAAVDDNKNRLSTGTLTISDIQNHADYKADSFGVSATASVGGSKSEQGGQQQQAAGEQKYRTEMKKVAGTTGANANMPVAMVAGDKESSITLSGISGAQIEITDEAQQQARTGKTANEVIASINRDVATGKDTSGYIANNFDKEEVLTGFAVVSAFTREVGTYITQSAAAADAKKKAAEDPSLNLSVEQRRQLLAEAKEIEDNWGPGGTYRQIATALSAAAGGNVGGSTAQFAQAAVVNFVQQQGAEYIGKLVTDKTLKEGSPEHAALHAIVGCAGAAASSQNCGAGAMGAAASSLLTNLFDDANPNETNVDKENKRNLVATLVAGVAAASSPSHAATAVSSAIAEMDNNWLSPKLAVMRDKAVAACDRGDKKACEVKKSLNDLDEASKQAMDRLAGDCKAGDTRSCDQAKAIIKIRNDIAKNDIQTCPPPHNCLNAYQSEAHEIGDAEKMLPNQGSGATVSMADPLTAYVLFRLGLKSPGVALIGAGGGAAGESINQLIRGDGTINYEKIAYNGIAGWATGPVGTQLNMMGNVGLGAITNASVTAYNNSQQGSNDSVFWSAVWGAAGSAYGYKVGEGAQNIVGDYTRTLIVNPSYNPSISAILQPHLPRISVPNPSSGTAVFGGITGGSVGQASIAGIAPSVPNETSTLTPTVIGNQNSQTGSER